VHFSRCLNVIRDGEEVMCEGKSFHIHAPVTLTTIEIYQVYKQRTSEFGLRFHRIPSLATSKHKYKGN